MEINSNLDVSSVLSSLSATQESETETDTSFQDILTAALDDVAETESDSDEATIDLLTGEDTTIHETMIASEKAELALEMALQVRNKVIDAYNEVMGMQL